MAAQEGNRFWELRGKHGRDKIFETPESLWEAACEYFQWCEDNPLYECKAFSFQGEVIKADLPKMRAMTMSGLCFYLGVNDAYFRQLTDEDFSTVVQQIETVIYNQKFQGAAADLLNANIIARDLGLVDKQGLEHSGGVVWHEEKTYEAHNKADTGA